MDEEASGQLSQLGSEGSHISVKIKTLDGRMYSISVPKDILVSALKERLAGEVNVSPEMQRLICRGKVLKDDQLLSTYNVDDGHTLHLVARLSAAPSADHGQPSATGEATTISSGQGGGPSIEGLMMRGMSVPVNGNGMPDINSIVTSVLNSINLPGIVAPSEADGGEGQGDGRTPGEREGDLLNTANVEVRIDTVYGIPPGFGPMAGPPHGLFTGIPPSGPLQPRVQPTPEVGADSLSVMRHYIGRLESAFGNVTSDSTAPVTTASPEASQPAATASDQLQVSPLGLQSGPPPVAAEAATSAASPEASTSAAALEAATSAASAEASLASNAGTTTAASQPSGPSPSPRGREAGPGQTTPSEVAVILAQTEALIRGPVATALSNYLRDLEEQASVTDPAARGRLQRRILQGGSQLQQLGSLLQELGRAFVGVRYGVSPAEAHARLNYPVFINPQGPNPVIVQPRPAHAVLRPGWAGSAPAGQRQAPQPPGGPQAAGVEGQQAGPQGAPTQPGQLAPALQGQGGLNVRTMMASMDESGNLHIMADGVPVAVATTAGGNVPLGMLGASIGARPPPRTQTRGPADGARNGPTGNVAPNSSPTGGATGQSPALPAQFPTPPLTQLHVQSWGAPSHPGGQGFRFTFPMPGLGQGQGLSLGGTPAVQVQVQGGPGASGQAGAVPDLWSLLTQGVQGMGGGLEQAQGAQPGAAIASAQVQSESPGGQSDMGQLLTPLIRQLAGALNGGPQPPPPPPQAPPAAPPAPPAQSAAAAASSAEAGRQQAPTLTPAVLPQELPSSAQQPQIPRGDQPESAAEQGNEPPRTLVVEVGSGPGSEARTETGTRMEDRSGTGTESVETAGLANVAGSEAEAKLEDSLGAESRVEEKILTEAATDVGASGAKSEQMGPKAMDEGSAGGPESSSGGRGLGATVAPLGLGMGGLQPLPRLRRRAGSRQPHRPSSVGSRGLPEGSPPLPARASAQSPSGAPEGSPSMQQMLSRPSSSLPGQEGGTGRGGEGGGLGAFQQMLAQMGAGRGALSQGGASSPIPLDRLLGQLSQSPQGWSVNGGAGTRDGGDPLAGMLTALGGGGGGGGRGGAGGVLPPGLAGMMGQMMQNPAVHNMVQQMAERVEVQSGEGVGPGGLGGMDLGSMMAEMMPMVSQMMGGMGRGPGGSTRGVAAGTRGPSQAPQVEEEWRQALSEEEVASWGAQIEEDEQQQEAMGVQRPLSDAYLRGSPAKRQRTAMEGTAQRLQGGAAPQEVLRSVAQAAAREAVQGSSPAAQAQAQAEELAQHIATTPGLAQAYVRVLWHDLAGRLTADPDASDPARFPNATALFCAAADLEPDGGDRQA